MLKNFDSNIFICPIFPACPKFKLSLTGPDFTNWKVDDPFKKLGPIAIFSARRHWTAPRNVRLQKGGRKSVLLKSHSTGECICKRSSGNNKVNNGTCEVCQKYTTHRYEDSKNSTQNENVEYGFQLRGDAPVIISYVDMNSLADVRIEAFSFIFSPINFMGFFCIINSWVASKREILLWKLMALTLNGVLTVK